MQLTDVHERRPDSLISAAVGAVRMTERFLSDGDPEKPARAKDMQRLRDHVAAELGQAKWLNGRGGRLVGTGGAVRNLAAADQRAAFGVAGGIDIGVQGYFLSAAALDRWRRRLRHFRWPSAVLCLASSRDAATSSWLRR